MIKIVLPYFENEPEEPEVPEKPRPVARVKLLRMRLRLTQEQFANRYGVPLDALRDWEDGRADPDRPVEAYIAAIESDLYLHHRRR
jgi:putative transcriptional regulator